MGLRMPKKRGAGVQGRAYVRSPEQEKERADSLGGNVTKGSGNGVEKGDVRVKGIARLELKATANKSFSVTRDMVRKIEDAGCSTGEIPAIEIEFLAIKGNPKQTVAVVPSWVLDLLVDRAKNGET